jgi:hypothetical protein
MSVKEIWDLWVLEYYKQKKIVSDYFEPIIKKEKEDKEKALYLELKSKYE